MSESLKIPAILIAGVSSGSGKTTITRGILSYLVVNGYKVQSYKLGPDYIDSGHHAVVTGRPCINLDRYLLSVPDASAEDSAHSKQQLLDEFHSAIGDAEVVVIEAVGGLYDDWHRDQNSPAEIAKLLGVAVMVVMDARASCQTAGIMTNGLIAHDPDLEICGFVFTKVNSELHFQSILDGIDEKNKNLAYCHLPFMKDLHTEERHLGLHTAEEMDLKNQITRFAEIFKQYLPFEQIFGCHFDGSRKFSVASKAQGTKASSAPRCRFAIARDRAFSFYYEYNLEALRRAGAELVFFSPLDDGNLPENIAGIYFGGGYPELHAEQLSKNVSLREEIKNLADAGLPIYAECGGLIYLGAFFQQHETETIYPGVGIFPYSSHFSPNLYLGYTRVEVVEDCLLGPAGTLARGHVFHRSDTEGTEGVTTSTRVYHETKKITQFEGYTYKNVYASYAHLHFKSSPEIAKNMIDLAVHYSLK